MFQNHLYNIINGSTIDPWINLYPEDNAIGFPDTYLLNNTEKSGPAVHLELTR